MAKTDWTMYDTIMPEDMNQIGEEINEAKLAAAEAEAAANQYTEQQIASVNEGITAIEKKLDGDEVRDLTISNRLSVIHTDQATPLHLNKLWGRTVVNHIPLFDSGLWTIQRPNEVVINSPSKMTVASPTGSSVASIVVPVKSGASYAMSAEMQGSGANIFITAMPSNFLITVIAGQYQRVVFDTPLGTEALSISFRPSQGVSTTLENLMLNEGSQPQEFVAGMKNLRGAYMKRYGSNLIGDEWVKGSIATNGSLVSADNRMRTDALKILPDKTYTHMCYNPDYRISVKVYDFGGNFLQGTPFVTEMTTFTTHSDAAFFRVLIGKMSTHPTQDTLDIAEVLDAKAMMNIGSEILPFESQNNDYLYAGVELASNASGSVADEIEYRDGRYWKTRRFEKVELDGNANVLESVAAYTGCKRVGIQGLGQAASNSGTLVKYNGKILSIVGTFTGSTGDDWGFVSAFDNKTIYITIPNADSGWGASYTPTADEIKAYFNGWRMYQRAQDHYIPYNGTGVKAWIPLMYTDNGVSLWTDVLPTYPAPSNGTSVLAYTPYQLQYQLATTIAEDVTDKIEGSISLHSGDNLVEIGEAVVVREYVKPRYSSGTGRYYINWAANSQLAHPLREFIRIYEDGNDATALWITNETYAPYGRYRASAPEGSVDPNATHTVTYVAELYAYSAPIQSIDVQYSTNIKTVLDRTVQDVADLTTRVSEIPSIYATIRQEAVVHPTILGGWTSMDGFGFMKMSDGLVIFQGGVNGGGIINANTVSLNLGAVPVCYLPPEYRPRSPIVALVPCRTGTFAMGTWGTIRVHIHPSDGKVAIYEHDGVQSAEYVWFDRIVFYGGV